MTPTIQVDLTRLREAAPAFAALSAEVEALGHALSSTLDAAGACWGLDEMGRTFAQGYLPAAARVRESFGELADGVREVAGAIESVVNNLDAAEDRAQLRLTGRR